MANRTGTYVAFDGLGETDPTKSDFKYYSSIEMWNAGKTNDFSYTNSHDKTAAVLDTSKRATLEARIRQRLAASKNVIVILSNQTRKSGSMLSYEIEMAVDRYDLPLICAYTGHSKILKPSAFSSRWPNALAGRIDDDNANAIHIPFLKNPLLAAINDYTVNSGNLSGPLNHYTRQAHVNFGCI